MIKAYLINMIVLNKYMGQDKYQEPLPRDSDTIRARVDFKERHVNNANGELVVSMAKIYLENRGVISTGFSTRLNLTISYRDTITIDGIDHTIILISREQDFSARFLAVYVS